MPKTKKVSKTRNRRAPRPIQDVVVKNKQSEQFPGVGMTLTSYNRDGAKARSNANLNAPKKRFYKRAFHGISLKRSVIALLFIVLVGGGYFGGRFIYDLHKAFGGSIFDILHSAKLKGEDSGRVNILLAGEAGENSGQTGGANLTDSIMVVSLDTKNNTGFLLSIPRDLYVNVPNYGYSKINAAYENGGASTLESIVSKDLGIPIDYYAVIDYDAFKQAVDAVGGIKIDIQSPDPRGIYDAYTHLRLPNGEVSLDGQEALNLARARGDDVAGDISYGLPNSDFDRTLHQRQMLVALKNKAETVGVLANPLKLSGLFDALGNNLKTDLNLSDVRTLYSLSNKIPNSKIKSLSLNNDAGQSLLADYTDRTGQEDLVPAAGLDDYSDIQNFVLKNTSNSPIVQESATVVVLNGTNTDGLASTYKQKLENQHINVTQIGDAHTSDNPTSEIIDLSNGKDPATRAALINTFGNNVTTTNSYQDIYSADFIVIVGDDKSAQ